MKVNMMRLVAGVVLLLTLPQILADNTKPVSDDTQILANNTPYWTAVDPFSGDSFIVQNAIKANENSSRYTVAKSDLWNSTFSIKTSRPKQKQLFVLVGGNVVGGIGNVGAGFRDAWKLHKESKDDVDTDVDTDSNTNVDTDSNTNVDTDSNTNVDTDSDESNDVDKDKTKSKSEKNAGSKNVDGIDSEYKQPPKSGTAGCMHLLCYNTDNIDEGEIVVDSNDRIHYSSNDDDSSDANNRKSDTSSDTDSDETKTDKGNSDLDSSSDHDSSDVDNRKSDTSSDTGPNSNYDLDISSDDDSRDIDNRKSGTSSDTDSNSKNRHSNNEASAKKLSKYNKRKKGFRMDIAFKIMGTIGQFVEVLGALYDIVMMFLPTPESAELIAIKKGFAEVNIKLENTANELTHIKAMIDWGTIASSLLDFESAVTTGMDKYNNLNTYINNTVDLSSGILPTRGQTMLEELINFIESQSIDMKLDEFLRLVRGDSSAISGDLFQQFQEYTDNDCNQIIPFSSRLFLLLRGAQKLQYFYEVNQGLVVDYTDNKGYPDQMFQLRSMGIQQLAYCSQNAIQHARSDMMEILAGSNNLVLLNATLNAKYSYYYWAVMESTKKRDEHDDNFLIVNKRSQLEQAHTADKITTRIFAVPASNLSMPKIHKELQAVLETYDKKLHIQSCAFFATNSITDCNVQEIVNEASGDIQSLLRQHEDLWNVIETMVIFAISKDDDTDYSDKFYMVGWHFNYRMNFYLFDEGDNNIWYVIGYLEFRFLFNNNAAIPRLPCAHGDLYRLSDSDNHQICICDRLYIGDSCDELIKKDDDYIYGGNIIMGIIEAYKVPGMLDMKNIINEVADRLSREMANNTDKIIHSVQQTQGIILENKNAILSVESVILNELKNNNAEMLREFKGLRNALDGYFTKARNERIIATERGQALVLNAMASIAKQTTYDLIRLDGRLLENRFFDTMELHLPIFWNKFSEVTKENATQYTKQEFSDYLNDNYHDFNVAKRAIKLAIVGSSSRADSFIAAQMKLNIQAGCTETYHDIIQSVITRLHSLYEKTIMIELWDIDYKKERTNDKAEKEYLVSQKQGILIEVAADAKLFTAELQKGSCPGFNATVLLGGGCKDFMTYKNQEVPLKCSAANHSLVLRDAENTISVSDVICVEKDNQELNWNIEVLNLDCARNCFYNGDSYGYGEIRSLPETRIGYIWVDDMGNVIADTTCTFPKTNESSAALIWSYSNEVDMNECDGVVCGYNGACRNTAGSYTCECPEGFYENSLKVCEDINECSTGGVGFEACLVGSQLGSCINNVGGYECRCFRGSYTTSNTNCSACNCRDDGVTNEVCDRYTGQCICNAHVGGSQCQICITAFKNYPICNECGNGYYGYPGCTVCDCNTDGTYTTRICNADSGTCDCAPNKYYGSRCNQCCPNSYCGGDYGAFPSCTHIVRDPDLGSWGGWSAWQNVGSCSYGEAGSLYKTSTRERTCNENARSKFGRYCRDFELIEEREDRTLRCYYVTDLGIRIEDVSWSNTGGNVWFYIRQGDIECRTNSLWHGTRVGWQYASGSNGCSVRFDKYSDVQVKLRSDSGDDAYIDSIVVYIDGSGKSFCCTRQKLHKSNYNDWVTLN